MRASSRTPSEALLTTGQSTVIGITFLVIYNSNQTSSLGAWPNLAARHVFLDIGLYSAESMITHAKSSLRMFLGSALGRKLTAETLEAAGEHYFAERRDYQADVETFFKSIRDYAPKSINMILSFTKGFLGRNGVSLTSTTGEISKASTRALRETDPSLRTKLLLSRS